MSAAALSSAEDISPFHDKMWRLSNLYYIQDKLGRQVRFEPNPAQVDYLSSKWFRDVIVKARQLGFSTVVDIDMLDEVIFNANFNALIIAHNLDDAQKLFRTKVRFPYDHLPAGLKTALEVESETTRGLMFASTAECPHDSRIDVATSGRSGTLQYVHVSEFGKIASHFPEKALEIISGTFEAVPVHGRIVVESTAEGAFGAFYDIAKRAKDVQDRAASLTQLDFRLHFHPWWISEENMLHADVIIDEEYEDYFDSLLRDHGVLLTPEQKSWYVKKAETLGERLKAENPSTFDEAFEAAVEGAYYARQMARMRLEHRLGRVPYDPNYPVITGWDLGMDDSTTIWFAQFYGGHELRLIDYIEDQDYGIDTYVRAVLEKPYVYEHHYLPHDARQRAYNAAMEGERTIQTARRLGLRPVTDVPRAKNQEEVLRDINIARRFLARSSIDERKCSKGVRCLDAYQKEWDDRLGRFLSRPLHNWASHGADALRTLAVALQLRYHGGLDDDSVMPEPTPDY